MPYNPQINQDVKIYQGWYPLNISSASYKNKKKPIKISKFLRHSNKRFFLNEF